MTQVSYSDLRQNLARYMDEAVAGAAPLLVTRQGGRGNVVILSEAEFEGWQAPVPRLRSPAKAAHLLASIAAADAGETVARDLVPAT